MVRQSDSSSLFPISRREVSSQALVSKSRARLRHEKSFLVFGTKLQVDLPIIRRPFLKYLTLGRVSNSAR